MEWNHGYESLLHPAGDGLMGGRHATCSSRLQKIRHTRVGGSQQLAHLFGVDRGNFEIFT